MGLFSKIKKAFKKIADIISPIKVVVTVVAKAVATVMRFVAEIEGLVYNAAKAITEAINFGPTWLQSLVSKVTNVMFDALMSSSRLKLGLGLVALGAISNNKAMRLEGRLELLTASLYFMRAIGAVPQWLIMIVMIFLSIVFPFIALIILAALVAGFLLIKFEIPKLEDDPDAMLKHLMMLRKYGLLDRDTELMLDEYVGKIGKSGLYDESGSGSFASGIDFEQILLDDYLRIIREALKNADKDETPFDPGDTTVPEAVQESSTSYVLLGFTAVALVALVAIGKT